MAATDEMRCARTVARRRRNAASAAKPAPGPLFGLRLTLAIVITLIMFFPIYWMLVTAFSLKGDLYQPGLHLWPQHLTLDNFRDPFAAVPGLAVVQELARHHRR